MTTTNPFAVQHDSDNTNDQASLVFSNISDPHQRPVKLRALTRAASSSIHTFYHMMHSGSAWLSRASAHITCIKRIVVPMHATINAVEDVEHDIDWYSVQVEQQGCASVELTMLSRSMAYDLVQHIEDGNLTVEWAIAQPAKPTHLSAEQCAVKYAAHISAMAAILDDQWQRLGECEHVIDTMEQELGMPLGMEANQELQTEAGLISMIRLLDWKQLAVGYMIGVGVPLCDVVTAGDLAHKQFVKGDGNVRPNIDQ